MTTATTKKIIIIAGPNGAGKTTFANEFLPNEANCINFVNADLIAAGISPYSPTSVSFKAGRIMLAEIESYVKKEESFAFETTLSGKHYATRIPTWRDAGYKVILLFLKLDSAETAIARVHQRVLAGGHDIPEDTIRRRFESGLDNFDRIYRAIVDKWSLYENSGLTPILLAEGSQ
jgi:predicted ABC-type ATPase